MGGTFGWSGLVWTLLGGRVEWVVSGSWRHSLLPPFSFRIKAGPVAFPIWRDSFHSSIILPDPHLAPFAKTWTITWACVVASPHTPHYKPPFELPLCPAYPISLLPFAASTPTPPLPTSQAGCFKTWYSLYTHMPSHALDMCIVCGRQALLPAFTPLGFPIPFSISLPTVRR